MSDHSPTAPPSDPELRIKALESLLVEKQLIDAAAVDAIIETYETKIGPRNGAKVVARAWVVSAVQGPPVDRRHQGNRGTRLHRGAGRRHGGGREYRRSAQRDRLHAVFLLSVADTRVAAGLVQGCALPRPSREGSARRTARIRHAAQRRRVWDSNAELRYLCCRNVRPAPRAGPRSNLPNWFRATP